MENKKVSLIKDINKIQIKRNKDSKMEIIKDERIVNENNKIMTNMFELLICVLVFGSIICDTINIKINTHLIFCVIGIVSYIGLILMCKKNIIERNESAGAFFIWSCITLPFSIFNIIDNSYYQNSDHIEIIIIAELIITLILSILLYQIANTIYRKNNKE